jgi:hypothetical protein
MNEPDVLNPLVSVIVTTRNELLLSTIIQQIERKKLPADSPMLLSIKDRRDQRSEIMGFVTWLTANMRCSLMQT